MECKGCKCLVEDPTRVPNKPIHWCYRMKRNLVGKKTPKWCGGKILKESNEDTRTKV